MRPYIFMDADYGRNRDRDGEPTKTCEPSLFVWAMVMSRPTGDRAIVDAGLKVSDFDLGRRIGSRPRHAELVVAAASRSLMGRAIP